MRRVLIIGAHGQIARVVTRLLLAQQNVALTLYLRRAGRLKSLASHPQVTLVEGDGRDLARLSEVMPGHDVVYANLSGDMPTQADAIVAAMRQTGLHRLVFISSMGIYGEVAGQKYRSVLDPYRDSAAIIEASGLDYTILRPAWLNDEDVPAYGLTRKGEPFKAAHEVVSRRSVADIVCAICLEPTLYVGESLGVHRQ